MEDQICGTHPFNLVECAKSYGLKAEISDLSISKLQNYLEQKIPIIANILKFVDDEFYIHSIVVYQVYGDDVYILDPEEGQIHLNQNLFEELWQKNEYLGIIIQK
ncbi:hypothetical protein JW964_05245 [candidate division KSB1 bacterium]|nr:hypothetical protein [candidate division KSB1 bacterium]